MADRYWVGGTGTWVAGTLTNWSATSGGAGGATVPTTNDRVFFDGNSGTGTCTLGANTASLAKLDFTGYAGTFDCTPNFNPLLGGATADLTMSSTMTAVQMAIFWGGASTGTLVSAGKIFRAITLASTTGTVTLGDALTCTIISHTSGTLDFGSFNHSLGSFACSGSVARTVTLNNSTTTVTGAAGWDMGVTTNLTVNAGTSTIIMAGPSGQTFNNAGTTGSSKNFYNLVFSTTQTANFRSQGTFNNIDVNLPCVLLQIGGPSTMTVTGVFTIGGSASARIRLANLTQATQHTFALGATGTTNLTYVDIRDTKFTGTNAPVSGTRLADCFGNSGVTFDAPITAYWVGNTGNFRDSFNWATTSGGVGGTSAAPVAHDFAIFDNNSFSANSQIVTLNVESLCSIDASALNLRTGITFRASVNIGCYGHLVGPSAQTYGAFGATTAGITYSLLGRGSFNVRMWSGATQASVTVAASGGTYTMVGDIGGNLISSTIWYNTFQLLSGTLLMNGFYINANTFAAAGAVARRLDGPGTIGINAATTATVFSATASSLTMNSSEIDVVIRQDNSGLQSFVGGGFSYGKLIFNRPASPRRLHIIDSGNSFYDWIFSDTNNIRSLSIFGTQTLRSSTPLRQFVGTPGKLMSMQGGVNTGGSSSPGTKATVNIPNGYAATDYLSLNDVIFTGNPMFAGYNSFDGAGNTNVVFAPEPSMLAMF